MKIKIEVEIELRHVSGKFASKSELEEKIVEEIEQSLPTEVTSDDDANYEVESSSVTLLA